MIEPAPRFCSDCGGRLQLRHISSESRSRHVCAACGAITYRNPKLLVNTIVIAGAKVLLCRRAQAPFQGQWVLPGGFVETGETLEEAGVRETYEETGVQLRTEDLRAHAVATLREIGEVYVSFAVCVPDATAVFCGPECSSVGFYAESEIPWSDFAHPDVAVYLRDYFAEQAQHSQAFHFGYLDADHAVSRTFRIAAIERVIRRRATATSQVPSSAANPARDPQRP